MQQPESRNRPRGVRSLAGSAAAELAATRWRDPSADQAGADQAAADQRGAQLGLPGRTHRQEAHAPLSADLHGVLGNSLLQGALAGQDVGYGDLVTSALTLGAAGMQVSDSAAGLLTNGAMQQALAVSRHGQDEDLAPDAAQRVAGALGRGGKPLPAGLRARMEAAFGGADFSAVRVHTDGAAKGASDAISARAFAVGEHIFFGRGGFSERSSEALHVLAHELTHVVQAQEGRLPGASGPGLNVSSPFDAHEREAESRASEVVSALSSPAFSESALDQGAFTEVAQEAGQAVGAGLGVSASQAPLSRTVERRTDEEEQAIGERMDAVMRAFENLEVQVPVVAEDGSRQERVTISVRTNYRINGSNSDPLYRPGRTDDNLGADVPETERGTELDQARVQSSIGKATPDEFRMTMQAAIDQGRIEGLPVTVAPGAFAADGSLSDTARAEVQTATRKAVAEYAKHAFGVDCSGLVFQLINANRTAEGQPLWGGQGADATEMIGGTSSQHARWDNESERVGDLSTVSVGDQVVERGHVMMVRRSEELPADQRADLQGRLGFSDDATVRSMTMFESTPGSSHNGHQGYYGEEDARHSRQWRPERERVRNSNDGWVQPRSERWGPTATEYVVVQEPRGGMRFYRREQVVNNNTDVGWHYREVTNNKRFYRTPLLADEVANRAAAGPMARGAFVAKPQSAGRGLPGAVLGQLRQQLGSGADRVRIHDGPEAADFADSLHAKAVTIGRDVFFGRNQFRPGSTEGDQLLGHEAHHAILGGGQAGVSQPGDAHERAADAFGDQFAGLSGAAQGGLQQARGMLPGTLQGMGAQALSTLGGGQAAPAALTEQVQSRLGFAMPGGSPLSISLKEQAGPPPGAVQQTSGEQAEDEEREPTEAELAALEQTTNQVAQGEAKTAEAQSQESEDVVQEGEGEEQALQAEATTEGQTAGPPPGALQQSGGLGGASLGPVPQGATQTATTPAVSPDVQAVMNAAVPTGNTSTAQSLTQMAWGTQSTAAQVLTPHLSQGQQQGQQGQQGTLIDGLQSALGVEERGDDGLSNTIEVLNGVANAASKVGSLAGNIGTISAVASLIGVVPLPPLPAVGLALRAIASTCSTIGAVTSAIAFGTSTIAAVLSAIQVVQAVKTGAPEALEAYARYQTDVGSMVNAGIEFGVDKLFDKIGGSAKGRVEQSAGRRLGLRGGPGAPKAGDALSSMQRGHTAHAFQRLRGVDGRTMRGQLFQGLKGGNARSFAPNLLSTKGSSVAALRGNLNGEVFRRGLQVWATDMSGKAVDKFVRDPIRDPLRDHALAVGEQDRQSIETGTLPGGPDAGPAVAAALRGLSFAGLATGPVPWPVLPMGQLPGPAAAPAPQLTPPPAPTASPAQVQDLTAGAADLDGALQHLMGVQDDAQAAIAAGQALQQAAAAHQTQAQQVQQQVSADATQLTQMAQDAATGQAEAAAGIAQAATDRAQAQEARTNAESQQGQVSPGQVPQPEGGGLFGRVKRWFQERVLGRIRQGLEWVQRLIADIILEVVAQCMGIDDIDAQLQQMQADMGAAGQQTAQAQQANTAVAQQAAQMQQQASQAQADAATAMSQGQAELSQAQALQSQVSAEQQRLQAEAATAAAETQRYESEHGDAISGGSQQADSQQQAPQATVDPSTVQACQQGIAQARSALDRQEQGVVQQLAPAGPALQDGVAQYLQRQDQRRAVLAQAEADLKVLGGQPAASANAALSQVGQTVQQCVETANTDLQSMGDAVSQGIAQAPDGGAVAAQPHTVVRGDTLWDIAERELGDPMRWAEIADLNQLNNPDLIFPGESLNLPTAGTEQEDASAATSGPSAQTTTPVLGGSGGPNIGGGVPQLPAGGAQAPQSVQAPTRPQAPAAPSGLPAVGPSLTPPTQGRVQGPVAPTQGPVQGPVAPVQGPVGPAQGPVQGPAAPAAMPFWSAVDPGLNGAFDQTGRRRSDYHVHNNLAGGSRDWSSTTSGSSTTRTISSTDTSLSTSTTHTSSRTRTDGDFSSGSVGTTTTDRSTGTTTGNTHSVDYGPNGRTHTHTSTSDDGSQTFQVDDIKTTSPTGEQSRTAHASTTDNAPGPSLTQQVLESTQVRGTLYSESVKAEAVALQEQGQLDIGGSTMTGEVKALHAEAQGKVESTIGPNGVQVAASAQAHLKLVELKGEWALPFGPFEFLGEEFEGRVYLFAEGYVGAEAKAKIEANARAMQSKGIGDPTALLAGTGLESNRDGDVSERADGPGVDVGVSGDAFAGASAAIGAGGVFDWNAKGLPEYGPELERNAPMLISAINVAAPGLGWLLNQAGAGEGLATLFQNAFSWDPGKTRLLGVEAALEGSAGIGARIDAKAGFSGGKITFKMSAGLTFGLGGGVNVNVSVGVVDGIKLALVTLDNVAGAIPELATMATTWLQGNVTQLVSGAFALWDAIVGWFTADDKIREAVANRAHEVAPAQLRAEWIETLSSGWCGNEDEDAIIAILRFSKSNGDLGQVLSAGMDRDDILWELGGEQWHQAKAILG